MPYRIGYCTSGFSSHRLEEALQVLAELGYRGVFLTLDVGHLDPYAPELAARTRALDRLLRSLDLAVVVETGARFVLDPRRKHHPTLLSGVGADRRVEFLKLACDVARDLGSKAVSLWSGACPEGVPEDEAWKRLEAGLLPLLSHADARGVSLAFEPEPGMLVETLDDYARLKRALGAPAPFGLSLDVGHLLVNDEGDPAELIARWRDDLLAVAIEDMRRGVHDHLPFGEGDLDLPSVIAALDASGFAGVVAVELARHGHDAVRVATASRDRLAALGVPFAPRGSLPR